MKAAHFNVLLALACVGACSEVSNKSVQLDLVDRATHAAVVFGSCLTTGDFDLYTGAMLGADGALWLDLPGVRDCLASERAGCAAIETCLGWKIEPPEEPQFVRCEGTVVTRNGPGIKATYDCASHLGDWTCKPDIGCVRLEPECNATFEPRCDGDAPVRCEEASYAGLPGVLVSDVEVVHERCGFGSTCAADGEVALCVGSGAACEGRTTYYQIGINTGIGCVDENELEICLNGKTHVIDCAEYADGYTCQQVNGEAFCGASSDCTASARPAACDGSDLIFCAGGRAQRVACESLGFADCMDDDGAVRCGPL